MPAATGRARSASATLADLLAELPRLGQPDVVFNLFEGFAGVGRGEALVAGWIEALGQPLTGSDRGGAGIGARQSQSEMAAARRRPADGRFCAGRRPIGRCHGRHWRQLLAAGPAIVKPAHEDASLGIGPHSVVSDRAALDEQIAQVRGSTTGRCWSSDSSPAANSTPRCWRCPSRDCCRWPRSNLRPTLASASGW